jgi:hypothetical protein
LVKHGRRGKGIEVEGRFGEGLEKVWRRFGEDLEFLEPIDVSHYLQF